MRIANTAFLPMNSASGSVSIVCALAWRQRRALVKIRKPAPIRPISIEVHLKFGPKTKPLPKMANSGSLTKSGMKPELML